MRTSVICIVACIACGHLPRDARAQVADVRRIRFTVDTLVITGGAGSETRGTAIQSLSSTKLGRRDAVLQVYWHRSASSGTETLDSLWMSTPDLRPLRHTRHSAHSQVSLDYVDARVQGHTSLNGERRAVDEALPANTFDGAAIDLVARALRLEDGVETRLNFYMAGFGPVSSTARLVGRDTIVTRSGQRAPARSVLVTLSEEQVLIHAAEDTGDLLQVIENPNGLSPIRHRR